MHLCCSFHSVLLIRSVNVTVLLLHCALCLFGFICQELKCDSCVLWCLLVSCETNCSALLSGHCESQMELRGFRRTLNFLAPLPLFFSKFLSFCCFSLFFDLEAIPAGREEVGSIRLGTFGHSNVLLTMCLPEDTRLIRLSDRAELLSEESSVH